jgi:hypothetical protein
MVNIWTEFKYWIIGISALTALAGGLTLQEQKDLTDQQINALPIELKLKTDKANILESRQIEDIRQEGIDKVSKGMIVSYDFVSDKITDKNVLFKEGEKYSNVEIAGQTEAETTYNFYGGDVYSKENDGIHEIVKDSTTTIEAFDLQTKDIVSMIKKAFVKVAYATDYVSSSGDGYIQYYLASGTTWSAIRSGTAGTATDYTNTACQTQEYSNGVSAYAIARIFMAFDTSAIDDSATIDSASLNITTQAGSSRGDVYVDGASQPSTSALTNADYDLISGTAYSAKLSPAGDNTLNTVSLNATGLSGINKTGYTKVSIRGSNDYDNIDIGGSYNTTSGFYTSEQSGTSYDPYLSVTTGLGGSVTTATSTILNFKNNVQFKSNVIMK